MKKDEIKQELYMSPEAEVLEMNSLQVICASNAEMPVDEEFNF